MIEAGAAVYLGPWSAFIMFGNVAGCACLFVLFKHRTMSIVLYLLLAVCESFLYATRIVSPHLLLWITDSVPTLIAVATLTAHSRFTAKYIASASTLSGRV